VPVAVLVLLLKKKVLLRRPILMEEKFQLVMATKLKMMNINKVLYKPEMKKFQFLVIKE